MFCRFHKFMISNAIDSDRPLWSVTQSHVDQCPQCSRFHTLCRSMGRRLKADAGRLDGIVSDRFSERILDGVAAAGTARMPIPVNLRPALAVAACALVVGAISVVLLMRPSRPQYPDQYARAVAAARELYESGTVLAGGLTRDTARLSSIVERPFEDEIRNLTADTESAFRFVTSNVVAAPPMAQLRN